MSKTVVHFGNPVAGVIPLDRFMAAVLGLRFKHCGIEHDGVLLEFTHTHGLVVSRMRPALSRAAFGRDHLAIPWSGPLHDYEPIGRWRRFSNNCATLCSRMLGLPPCYTPDRLLELVLIATPLPLGQ